MDSISCAHEYEITCLGEGPGLVNLCKLCGIIHNPLCKGFCSICGGEKAASASAATSVATGTTD